MEAPTLVFDGDCRFCRKWISRFRRWTRGRIPTVPWQEAAARFPRIPREDFNRAIHLVQGDGTVSRGAAAAFRGLAQGGATPVPWWLYRKLPPLAALAEAVYRFVARHRETLSRLEFTLSGPGLDAPAYGISSRWLVRGLGAVYLVAFVSVWMQADGLVGSQGIAPAHRLLEALSSNVGLEAVPRFPTLFWISASDTAIQAVCAAGTLAALVVLAGYAAGPLLLLLWALYLSLCTVASPFLDFQWDSLLLEAGFIAVWFAPWHPRRLSRFTSFPWPGLLLFRWLLFKLMFWSGVVKLSSGDPTWRTLSALDYHFETQPLPNTPAWWFHQLPEGLLMALTAGMFLVELVLPFLVFGPRRLRLTAAAGFLLLQGGILFTGNYGFFNLLAMLLCLVLIDDGTWRGLGARIPRLRTAPPPAGAALPPPAGWRTGALAALAALTLLINIPQFCVVFRRPVELPGPLLSLYRTAAPFRTINHYGLFAVMTRERREIILEGSRDGREWKPYVFRYKPAPPGQRPLQVAPLQPRLDWQMWFAALGTPRDNPWFMRLVEELLQGSPPVLGLLEDNPFPDTPPRYIRANLYRYQFTNPYQKERTGDWWTREFRGTYLSPVSLRQ